ncbi:MAG: DUF3299 domain-containing protein [Acidobacteriota bacterium]
MTMPRTLKVFLPLLAVAALILALVPSSRSLLGSPAASPEDNATAIDWQLLLGLDSFSGEIDDPALAALDGEVVTLAGYVVPLDLWADELDTFLLVPYMGACIHVPPPPPEQMVLVTLREPVTMPDMWIPQVITGHLTIKPIDSPYGSAGYSLDGLHIKEFDDWT